MLDPVAVALKFGFLAVLYLFLLWMAARRSRTCAAARPTARRVRRGYNDATGLYTARAGATPAPTAQPRLRVGSAAGLQAGAAYDLSDGALLGRGDEADIVLEDSFASTRHARLAPHGDVIVLEDLGSTNGTYLNERAAARAAAPAPGRPDPHRRLRVHLRALTCCGSPSTSHDSDLGRQRQGNEDNYFVRAPAVRGRGRDGRRAGRRGRVRARGRGVRRRASPTASDPPRRS